MSLTAATDADPSVTAAAGQTWTDLWCLSQDGLKLYARDYGPREAKLTPVLCIPGLTRSTRDFHDLASHLASRPRKRRRIVTLDLRGRGRSDYDRDGDNYTPKREVLDVLDVMTVAGIEKAVVIGTSRGGIIAMAMAAVRPAALAGIVLNDIGPRIEPQGLVRIVTQLSRMPRPRNWDEAAALLKRLFQESFTDLSDGEWAKFAREVFRDDNGRPRPDYDRKIIRQLGVDDIADGAVPEIWQLFEATCAVPVLAIRGANSDILSPATLGRMAEHHPEFASVTVPNRGHAPFLREAAALDAIDEFLNRIDHRVATA